jgi:hypothetical protein
MEGIMRLQDKIAGKTIGVPKATKTLAADRPLIVTAPAAV